MKTIAIPFGDEHLEIRVPEACASLKMREVPAMADPAGEVGRAYAAPIESPPLPEIIRAKGKSPETLTACVTVSDITRPVPYRGPNGILGPLLRQIEGAGVLRENITLLIGNGMHRPSTAEERDLIFGEDIVAAYRIVDHDSDNRAGQVLAAHTAKGTAVYVNRFFYDADVKVVTGLVESHFMAGVSGGRKGVCPALVNTETIQNFHGPGFLEDPRATNLVIEGNPCHEESLEVARTVGVDFLVNTTLDHALRLTGVFAGDLEAAHLAAFDAMKDAVRIPVERPYDIVLTHGGYVGRNHYQCAKAAVGAMPALREGGILVLSGNNFDVEPVGGLEYRSLLHLLKLFGPDRYVHVLESDAWQFTKDQWQPEMWAKPLRMTGMDGLVYCAPQIDARDAPIIPGVLGQDLLPEGVRFDSVRAKAEAMLQGGVDWALAHPRFEGLTPSIAFVEEGPYAIPMLLETADAAGVGA